MKEERREEPEEGGRREEGAARRWGDGEGGSPKARRGPRFPLRDTSRSGAWAGGRTAEATLWRTVI